MFHKNFNEWRESAGGKKTLVEAMELLKEAQDRRDVEERADAVANDHEGSEQEGESQPGKLTPRARSPRGRGESVGPRARLESRSGRSSQRAMSRPQWKPKYRDKPKDEQLP